MDSWRTKAAERDWLNTSRPWSVFIGLGEPSPFGIPSTRDWKERVPHNLSYFVSNYTAVALLAVLVMMFLHPRLLLWGGLFGGLGYVVQVASSSGLTLPVVAGVAVEWHHIKAAVNGSAALLAVWLIGAEFFQLIGIISTVCGLHALLRTERFDSPKDQMEAAAASVSAQAAAPGAVYTATSTPGHAGADPIVGEA